MERLALFALIGGALVTLIWLVARELLAGARRNTVRRRRADLAADGERAARLTAGGQPDHPIEVAAPSVVDAEAESMACVLCGGDVRVVDHQARTVSGERLRVAQVECTRCGHRREVFFRLVDRTVH